MSSFRITMGMKMNRYRYNLMGSTNRLYNAEEKVDTHRKFNSYAESPADATHAWRVRREFMDNDAYARNNTDTQTRFQTAWLTMGTIKTDLEDNNDRVSILRALNDPTGQTGKQELGNILSNTAESIIQAMNGAKYGHTFVFSGTDGSNPPFSWGEDGTLYYRGVSLNSPSDSKWPTDAGNVVYGDWGSLGSDGIPENFKEIFDYDPATGDYADFEAIVGPKPPEPTAPTPVDETLYPNRDTDPTEQAAYDAAVAQYEQELAQYEQELSDYEAYDTNKEWYTYFTNMDTLNKMANEVLYSDMGMGMKMDDNGSVDGTHIQSTYFNNALPGIDMLGYGVDEDGDPKNIVLLSKEIAAMLAEVDENGKSSDPDRLNRLAQKFDAATDYTISKYTEVDTKQSFVRANGDNLEDQATNLAEQVMNLEQVDMADAITQLMWDYNCYNAALKIGTQILTGSLIDYMT